MLKIGTKLGLGIAALLLLCVVIGLVSYTQTRRVGEKVEEITKLREPINSAVHGLENNLVESAFAAMGYMSTGNARLVEDYQRDKASLGMIQQRYFAAADGEEERDFGKHLQQDFAQFHAIAIEQIALRDSQTTVMKELFGNLDTIDRLLTDRVQASISADDPLAFRRLQAALEMEVYLNAITKSVGNFLLTGQGRFETRIHAAERAFRHYFGVYQNVLLSSEEKGWAAELQRLSGESSARAAQIISLEKLRMEGQSQFLALYKEIEANLNGHIQTRTEQGLAAAKEDVLEAGSAANRRILAALLFSVGFGICAGVVTTKSITRPIHQLATVMHAIAGGERLHMVHLKASEELQSLGEAFNLMIGQLVRANDELRQEVAERQRAEAELRASEEQFRLSIEAVRDYAIIMLDTEGRVASWNAGAERLQGFHAGEITGEHFSLFYPEEDVRAGKPGRELARAAEEGRVEDEGWRVRKDGSRYWANVVMTAVRDEGGRLRGFSKVTRDITEQKRLQRQLEEAEKLRSAGLRRFAAWVQRAQEEERERISRELHDDLCQRLSGVKFRVEAVEDESPPINARVARQLRECERELDHAITEVRRISSNLRPSVLDDFGLVPALKLLCKDFEKLHGVRVALQCDTPALPEVDSDIEIALYRIAQEALSNVAKHAHASAATLHLLNEDTAIRLIIEDDGTGFDQEDATRAKGPGRGLGLISMRERSQLLGGTFTIDSSRKGGTAVTVTIPRGWEEIHEESQNSDRRRS